MYFFYKKSLELLEYKSIKSKTGKLFQPKKTTNEQPQRHNPKKTLETEKQNLLFEIDGLKKTADAKATALETEIVALLEEAKSLKILLGKGLNHRLQISQDNKFLFYFKGLKKIKD
jgi:hypothetical protein